MLEWFKISAWFMVGFIDTILKGFQYGWFFIVPIILVITILIYKRKKSKIYSLIAILLIVGVISLLLTSRMWGPKFYKYIITFSIDNKQELIEEKLEKKYNRNFTFVSKEDVKLNDKDAGSILGQDINGDYSITYIFKDDDGVIAIVKYQRGYGCDYYESKRSKYELEKSVYDYANKIGINNQFYVFVTNPYEAISSSSIDEIPKSDCISTQQKNHTRILLILPKPINGTEKIMYNALKKFLINRKYIPYVHEYVVTEEAYKKAVTYYESEKVKSGIEEEDYRGEFKFSENEKINFRFYWLE